MTRKRRENHAVHIYRPLGARTWWIQYTHDGKQHRRNSGFAEEGQARIYAAKVARMVGLATNESLEEKKRLLEIVEDLIKDIRELEGMGESLGKDKNLPSVRHWFNRRLDEISNGSDGDDRQLKAGSVERVANVFRSWITYLEGLPLPLADSPLNRIGPDEIRGFLAESKRQGLAGATRKFALSQIRSVFGRAVNKGLIPTNPASATRLGKLKFDAGSIRRAFTPRQIAAIFDASDASPDRWIGLSARLGLYSGQRISDICQMRWEHIKNFDGPLPTISLIQKKTGSHVTIPIADSLREALRAVPEEHRTGYLLGEIAAHYLAGRRRRFIRAWRSLLEDVKLPTLLDTPVVTEIERAGPKGRKRYSFTYHSWRHTCATYLSGADSHYLLGHRNKQEKALGETANYRHEDLQRLKIQLDAIPIKQAENVIQLTATG